MKIIANISGYKIRITKHAEQRQHQRNVDDMQVISCITSLGTKKLSELSINKVDVLVEDTINEFSVVFNISGKKINVITVIDKKNCFVKSNTIKLVV